MWIDTLYDAARTFPFVLGRVPLRELDLSITERCSEPDPIIIERIQTAYRKAKEAQRTVEPEYLPSGEWKDDIPRRRSRYISALNATTTRPLRDLFREFFRNEGIAGLWCYGYYDSVQTGSIVEKALYAARIHQDVIHWKQRYGQSVLSLKIPDIGNPWGIVTDGTLITSTSCRHHHLAHQVGQLLETCPSDQVLEIGGGFGGVAYYLHRTRGEKPIHYVNLDIPEVLVMSQYFLMHAISPDFALFGEDRDWSRSLLPNFVLPELASNAFDVVVNTGSLPEMARATVEVYISQITRVCHRFFLSENSNRGERKPNHTEIAASEFPLSPSHWRRVYSTPTPWGGSAGRMVEEVYERQ